MKVLLKFTILALITIINPITTFAQEPNLGLAKNMAVFTAVGALGNTDISNVTGDMGTGEGAITGFDFPSIVNGTIDSGNVVTAQCALDVQAAYDEIFAIPATVTDHAPAFGGGETIVPGVYLIGAAGSIFSTLILDAQGNSEALFIFKFGGAFGVSASSSVLLINGASSSKIFWIAEGAMDMAASTDMKGTLISSNGAVSMGAGAALEGRMLSTAGAATMYKSSIVVPSPTLLPIELLSFTGHCNSENTVLEWTTATEINNNHFTIERSQNGINWQTVDKVNGAGNSSSRRDYMLTDIEINKESSYYRLKQTDHDGTYEYADIIYVNKCQDNEIASLAVYPNPSNGQFELRFEGNTTDISAIDVVNAQGHKIYSSSGFQSKFDLSNHVPGLYFINVRQNSEIINMKFIIKD